MKGLIRLTVIILILNSCKQSNVETTQTVVITLRDSCEYIFVDCDNKTVLLYKDSCVECRESVKKTWKSFTILQQTNRFNSLKKQD